jgi:pimeloyl-ACP methyl ester carboxylesterase
MKPVLLPNILLVLISLCLMSGPLTGNVDVLASQTQSGTAERASLDKLIDVGGYRLHIKCVGNGSPTVILEAGLGGGLNHWSKVMPDIGKFTRVCAYDRPSEGDSDPAPRPLRRFGSHTYIQLRTGNESVQDLHNLLLRTKEAGPYVFVGHSLGGIYVMLYANQYPKEIVGMVLVDASHPDQFVRQAKLIKPELAKQDHDGLMQNREGADIDQILAKVRATHWHSDIPLYVLARGRVSPPPSDWSAEAWAKYTQAQREMQADHARRSRNGKLIIAEKSGHDIPNDQPELVVDAIRQVVSLARK